MYLFQLKTPSYKPSGKLEDHFFVIYFLIKKYLKNIYQWYLRRNLCFSIDNLLKLASNLK